jgi:hypothetical protein
MARCADRSHIRIRLRFGLMKRDVTRPISSGQAVVDQAVVDQAAIDLVALHFRDSYRHSVEPANSSRLLTYAIADRWSFSPEICNAAGADKRPAHRPSHLGGLRASSATRAWPEKNLRGRETAAGSPHTRCVAEDSAREDAPMAREHRPELGACQRIPHVDAFAIRLADVKMAREHGLHVLKHRIEIAAID